MGTPQYEWQWSTDEATWTTAPGISNEVTYQPSGLHQTTYFRRKASYVNASDYSIDYSNTVYVTVSGNVNIAITENANYILNRTYTEADGSQVLANVEYYDGLGRPVQSIQIGGSPDGTKDIVAFTEYDNMGRVSRSDWRDATNLTRGVVRR